MLRAALFLLTSSSLLMGALPERKPWLSSFLSSSCALEQSHTEASQVDTTKGKKRRFFHSEKTSVIASAVFLPGLSSALVLDLTQTQKKNYGFDAISLEGEYALLSDLSGDVVSITGGGVLLFSPSSRICDLSSQNHSPLEVRAHLTIGKEFGYKGAHFYRAAGACRMGKGTRGAAWVGGDAFIQHVFKETHYTSLFFESEHGLSSKRLSSIDHFRGWATVGYTFGDIGLRYEFSHNWLAVFYSEARMRLFAHDALSKVWSVKLGIQFPLSLI